VIDSYEEPEEEEEVQGNLYTNQDIIDYLTDPVVKKEFDKVLADLRALGVESRPFRGGKYRWLEFINRDKEVVYLGTLKRAFKSQHYDPELGDWIKPLVIETYAEWEQKSKPSVVREIEHPSA
jgi:hypothetical protein